MAGVHADYQMAVKAAIVEQQFTHTSGAAVLAACNVQPVRVRHPVPHQACVPLHTLPAGQQVLVPVSDPANLHTLTFLFPFSGAGSH
jgi:hypothetical protein